MSKRNYGDCLKYFKKEEYIKLSTVIQILKDKRKDKKKLKKIIKIFEEIHAEIQIDECELFYRLNH